MERPLIRLSNLELIDIIGHPDRFTEELIQDAKDELEIRKHENAKNESKEFPFGSLSQVLFYKTSSLATPTIVWLNIIVFALVGLFGVDYWSPSHTSLFKVGGMQQYYFLTGDWWRPFSSMFLHSGLMHLGFNMYALIQIGPIAEHLIGTKRYSIIYIICGLMGALAMIGFGSNAVGVGASGAIFGIFGLTYILLKSPKIQGDKRQIRNLARQLGFFIVLNIVIGMSSKSISNEAHVGGLIAGGILAFIHLFNYPVQYRKVAGNAVSVALSSLVFFLWVGSMTPRESIIAEELKLTDEIRQNYGGISQRLMIYEELVKSGKLETKDSLNYYLPLLKDAIPEYQNLLENELNEDFSVYIKLLNEKVDNIERLSNKD